MAMIAGGAVGGAVGGSAGPFGCGVRLSGCGGGGEEKTVVSYVGTGGDWQAETTYKFVGGGKGDIEMVTVPTSAGPSRACFCWVTVSGLLLLGALLWALRLAAPTTAASPAPPAVAATTTPAPARSCSIFGDPHVMTFDGMHSDYYTPGEYWIVKSTSVKIQGRYLATSRTNGLAVTKEIAVGGPFLQGHTLIIGAEGASWDDQPILATFPSEFHLPGLADIRYDPYGQVMQDDRRGKPLHVVHADLPGGVRIQINRWNEPEEDHYINVQITMPPQPDQDGHCGNFNGNPTDDDRVQVRARLGKYGVAPGELMLRGGKTPIVPTHNRPDVNDCDATVLRQARAACKNREGTFFPSMECMIDYCFSGKQFAKQDFV